jgi:hypothetical protein
LPSSNSKKRKERFSFHIDERNEIHRLARKYGTDPHTGECYTEAVPCNKVGKTYRITIPESVAEKFLIPQEFIDQDEHILLMIKPVEIDGNYIFFRRL